MPLQYLFDANRSFITGRINTVGNASPPAGFVRLVLGVELADLGPRRADDTLSRQSGANSNHIAIT